MNQNPEIKVVYHTEFGPDETIINLEDLVSWMRRYPNLKVLGVHLAEQQEEQELQD